MPKVKYTPVVSLPMVGMESTDRERAEALAVAQGEALTAAMQQPGRSVSARAGKMEREAPLFFGQGDSPTLFH